MSKVVKAQKKIWLALVIAMLISAIMPGAVFADVSKDISASLYRPSAPTLYPVDENDTVISGGGTPGYTVVVTLPEGEQVTAVVDGNGNFTVTIPGGKTLPSGSVVSAIQINPAEPGNPSESVSRAVDGVVLPPKVDEVLDNTVSTVRETVQEVVKQVIPPKKAVLPEPPAAQEEPPQEVIGEPKEPEVEDAPVIEPEIEEKEPEILFFGQVPLGSFTARSNWSLLSLIIAALALIFSVVLAIKRRYSVAIKRILPILVSAFSAAAFIFLDDFAQPMGLLSISTLPVLVIAAVGVALLVIFRQKYAEEEA